jgi:hypothetical protein
VSTPEGAFDRSKFDWKVDRWWMGLAKAGRRTAVRKAGGSCCRAAQDQRRFRNVFSAITWTWCVWWGEGERG